MTSPRITVTSPLGPDELELHRLNAHESLGRAFTYDLYVYAKAELDLTDLLGQAVGVHVELNDSTKRHFNGMVCRASALGGEGRRALYHLQLRPWLALLEHNASCRIFQNEKVPDVIKAVFRDHGFTDFDDALTGTYRSWEYLVQYRESDLNFVMRLMEQEGIYFYIRQDESVHTVVLSDSRGAHEQSPGYEAIRYEPASASPEHVEDDVFGQWQFSQELRPASYSLDEFDFKNAKSDLFVRSAAPPAPSGTTLHELSGFEIYDYPGEYVQASEGDNYVKYRLQELRVDQATAQGSGAIRGLGTGHIFKLKDHPLASQNREYLVTSSSLSIEAPELESGGGGGDAVFHASFSVVDASVPFRLKRTTVKPAIHGVHSAVVVGKPGEEIWTDKFGRIKVEFHWDRTHFIQKKAQPHDETMSCWIRVSQAWAGSGFGSMHLPRIGQEVLVSFLEGDPDRPIVTGRVYNDVNMPPWDLPANQTQSGIKSRSSKGGNPDNCNEIRMEDKKGAEELFVQAERQHTVKVKKDRSLSVGGSETVSVSGTRTSTITKKSTDNYKDELEVNVDKKVAETFKDEHYLKITKKQDIEITADKGEHITGTYELKTDTCFQLIQGGTTMKFEGDAVEMNIAKSLLIERGSGKVTIDESGAITMESGVGIVIKCGSSKVEITPTGISIEGMMVVAKAQTSEVALNPAMAKVSGTMVNVEGTAMASVQAPIVKLN